MMSGKNVAWLVAYYVIVFAVVWLELNEHPPKVVFWYRLYRASQGVARSAGRLGINAERRYYQAVEESRL